MIYNVTVKVEKGIAAVWLQWLMEVHVPEVLATGCFTGAKILKICDIDESDGETYAIQYGTNTRSDYENYIANHADLLRKKSFDQWGNKFVAFRTLMEVIH